MIFHIVVFASALVALASYGIGCVGAYYTMRGLGRAKIESVWIGLYWLPVLCSELAVRSARYYVHVIEEGEL